MSPAAFVGACWLCAALAAVSSSEMVYKLVGDTVVLTPKPGSVPIESIFWKYGSDLVAMWHKMGDVEYFAHFKGRTSLNTSNGQMTIAELTQNDSEKYTAQINSVTLAPFDLRVLSAVPVPTVSQSCDDEKTSCTLTCDGHTSGAEPVTYTWKSDDTVIPTSSTKQHEITTDSLDIKKFSCELMNPVSQESSEPIPNPLVADTTSSDGLHPKMITGITVFVCLLVCVLLLVSIHRCKAGVWFYEKESMPWEGDFWRSEKTPQEQNTAARQEKHMDEETLMTQPNKTGSESERF